MVHPVERLLGRAVLVVVGPATNDGVQQANQNCLADGVVRINNSTNFLHKRVRVLLRRFHQWLGVFQAHRIAGRLAKVERRAKAREWYECPKGAQRGASDQGLVIGNR